jgi:Bacterial Ig-like domain (group 3)/Autotransporter beta-domain
MSGLGRRSAGSWVSLCGRACKSLINRIFSCAFLAQITAILVMAGFASPAFAISPPSITQTFSTTSIPLGGTALQSFAITNPNTSDTLTSVRIVDDFSLVSGGLTPAFNPAASNCSGAVGNTFISSGHIILDVQNITIPPNTNCTVTVTLTGTGPPGPVNNAATVSDSVAGVGNTLTTPLNVVSPAPIISKSFGAASISLNGTTALTITISNPIGAAFPALGVAFTDNFPAGLQVASVPNLTNSCGGTATTTGSSAVSLMGGTVSTTCTVTVNVTGITSGMKVNTTGNVSSTNFGTGNTASATLTVGQAATTVTLTSSLNPSNFGQAVTFTATVTDAGGTPTGNVVFKDGGSVLGTVALSGGIAAFSTASLTLGSHSITASYLGSANFLGSTSAALIQVVNTPADSLKLRALQVMATPVEAQASGQAISGAVDSAIAEGFSTNGGTLVNPSASGIRFNFAADPDDRPTQSADQQGDPMRNANGGSPSLAYSRPGTGRVDDALNALGAMPTKAPPRYIEQKDWLGWAEVRGAILDHWNGPGTVPGVPFLTGSQVNLLAGLTRRVLPNFVVGVLGGYETFDYRSDALQGRLKGDGWTIGSYLGWMVAQNVRFDVAVTYSGIAYDGLAGLAAGTFGGQRWLVSSGLTGYYKANGFLIEPSARVYALWEHENAYTDSLGTLQTARDFSTGRASGGVKVAYPIAWSPTTEIAPYVGLFADYYFNTDNATALVAPAVPTQFVLDGWSARAVGGVAARFGSGAQIAAGAERSGIGGNFALWIYRVRASVPFGAQ